MALMADWCQKSEDRKHFAKKGRLFCKKHFRIEYEKAADKLGFLFRDVYTRGITKSLKNSKRLTDLLTGTERESNLGDVYTVPVVLDKKHGFIYPEEKDGNG